MTLTLRSLFNIYKVLPALPGMVAGDRGPERDAVALAGEPTGGDVWGEKGDCAGLLCSP